MTMLKCKADTCIHNRECLCSRGDIMVGGKFASESKDTCCESFHEKKGEAFTSSMCHPSPTIMIDCEAINCRYNTNYKCTAKKVDISGAGATGSRETACVTFEEKK